MKEDDTEKDINDFFLYYKYIGFKDGIRPEKEHNKRRSDRIENFSFFHKVSERISWR